MGNHTRIDREAAEWVAELAAGDVDANLTRRFERWRCASPRHAKAYEEMSAVWQAADVLGVLPALSSRHWTPYKRRRSWKAITAIAFLALSGGFACHIRHEQQAVQTFEYSTEVGTHRVERLPDGSTVSLNTKSKVTVRMTRGVRRLELLRGEALFKVSPDTQRPFEVTSGKRTVRAIGTEFSVRSDAGSLHILVVSGAVALDPQHSVEILHAGESADVLDDGTVRKSILAEDEIQSRLLWTQGRVVFRDERLQDAIAEMNRYNKRQVRLIAPVRQRNLRIGGAFTEDGVDRFVYAISTAFGLQQIPSSDPNEILLAPRNRSSDRSRPSGEDPP
jgi:transmembrane sensor